MCFVLMFFKWISLFWRDKFRLVNNEQRYFLKRRPPEELLMFGETDLEFYFRKLSLLLLFDDFSVYKFWLPKRQNCDDDRRKTYIALCLVFKFDSVSYTEYLNVIYSFYQIIHKSTCWTLFYCCNYVVVALSPIPYVWKVLGRLHNL